MMYSWEFYSPNLLFPSRVCIPHLSALPQIWILSHIANVNGKSKLGVWMYTARCRWIKIFRRRHPLRIWFWHRIRMSKLSGQPRWWLQTLKCLNVYSFHLRIPSLFQHRRACNLLDVWLLRWATEVVAATVCVGNRFLPDDSLRVQRCQPGEFEHKLLIF